MELYLEWWGDIATQKVCFVSWDNTCLPCEEGSLRVKSARSIWLEASETMSIELNNA